MDAAWDGIHDGFFPQGSQSGDGQRILRHGRIHEDHGECRGNGGADESISQSEESQCGAPRP